MQSFLSHKAWDSLYSGAATAKALSILMGILRRFGCLYPAARADILFLHREATPLGPPIFEWFLAKVLRKKIIYDFDDAIWLPDPNEKNRIWNWLKWKSKIKWICRWSWKVSAGNDYLADYAAQYCDQVEVMPTIVDTNIHKPSQVGPSQSRPVIGWTGSHSTLQYLTAMLPVLQELELQFDFDFLVIANKDPKLPLRNYKFLPWRQDSEVKDLQSLDIGLMPLSGDDWSRGKCGFKAIQYGAIGIPSIVSPVGVNSKVVLHGETGFLCSTKEEWKNRISQLLSDPDLRAKMGKRAATHIQSEYAVSAVKQKFLNLFE